MQKTRSEGQVSRKERKGHVVSATQQAEQLRMGIDKQVKRILELCACCFRSDVPGSTYLCDERCAPEKGKGEFMGKGCLEGIER